MALPNFSMPDGSSYSEGGRRPVCVSSTGNYYILDETDQKISCWKAADPQGTWTRQDQAAERGYYTTDHNFEYVQDGDIIHVVMMTGNSNFEFARYSYRTFNMATDTWSSADELFYEEGNSGHACVRIVIRNGEPVVFHSAGRLKSKGTPYHRVGISWRNAGTWSYLPVDDGGTYTYANPQLVINPNNNNCYLFWANSPKDDWSGVQYGTINCATFYAADNTLSTTSTNLYYSSGSVDFTESAASIAVYVNNSGTNQMVVVTGDESAAHRFRIIRMETDGTDRLSFITMPEPAPIWLSGQLYTFNDSYYSPFALGVVDSSNVIHVLVNGGTSSANDRNIYYTKSDDFGVTWDAPTLHYDSGAGDVMMLRGGPILERNGDTLIPYFFGDSVQGAVYNEYLLIDGGGGSTQHDMSSSDALTLTENTSGDYLWSQTSTDTASLTETPGQTVNRVQPSTESLTLTETPGIGIAYPVGSSETLTLVESTGQTVEAAQGSTETLTLEESPATALNDDMWTGDEIGYITEGSTSEKLAKDFPKTRTTRWIKTPTDTGGILTLTENPVGSSDRGRWQFKDDGTVYYGTDEGTGSKAFRIGGKIDAVRIYYIGDKDTYPNATLEVTQAEFPVTGPDINTQPMIKGKYIDFGQTTDTLISSTHAVTTEWITLPSPGGTLDLYTYGAGSENRGRWQYKDSGGTCYWGGDTGGGDAQITLPAEAVEFRVYIGISDWANQTLYDVAIKHTPASTEINMNFTETLTLGETTGQILLYVQGSTEALTLGESGAIPAERPQGSTEPLTLTETTGQAYNWAMTSTDGAALAENSAIPAQRPQGSTEALTLTETPAQVAHKPQAGADPLTLTETPNNDYHWSMPSTEALTLNEAPSMVVTSDIAMTSGDSLTLNETTGADYTWQQASTDSAALGESTGQAIHWEQGDTEALTLTESPAQVAERIQGSTESLSLTETPAQVAELIQTATESLTLTETPAQVVDRQQPASESLTLIETTGQAAQVPQGATEALTLGETTGQTVNRYQASTEALVLTEDASTTLQGATEMSSADTLALNETTGQTGQMVQIGTDSLSLIETTTQAAHFIQGSIEGLTLTENSSQTAGGDVAMTSGDSLAVGESSLSAVEWAQAGQDPLTLGETTGTAIIWQQGSLEISPVTEDTGTIYHWGQASTEGPTLTEPASQAIHWYQVSQEALLLVEQASQTTSQLNYSEALGLTEISHLYDLYENVPEYRLATIARAEAVTGTLTTEAVNGTVTTDEITGVCYGRYL